MFFALVVKKPDKGEFEITEEALKLAEDEDFLQQSTSNQGEQRCKKLKLLPPDQARLIAMRAARLNERKMYSVLREVMTYYFFLALLLTIAYTHRSPKAYFQTRNMVNTMAGNFNKASSLPCMKILKFKFQSSVWFSSTASRVLEGRIQLGPGCNWLVSIHFGGFYSMSSSVLSLET